MGISRKQIKKWRLKIIITVLLFIAGMSLLILGNDAIESVFDQYTAPSGEIVTLGIKNGKYILNGEELEKVDKTFLDSFSHLLPYLPWLIPGLIMVFVSFYMYLKWPPLFMFGTMFGVKRKWKGIGKIQLDEAPSGVIGVRNWNMTRDGFLQSVAMRTIWPELSLTADTLPQVGGWKGIYAYRLGGHSSSGTVTGIVALTGHIAGHRDCRVRASKCTILILITKRQKDAVKLSQHYNCPIVVSSDVKQTLTNWILSSEGIFWLAHNDRLIKEKVEDKFEEDISNLPAYQSFGGI